MKDYQYIELEYPRQNDVKSIRVGLSDTRAADDIQVSYDFGRDGWVVKQDRHQGVADGMAVSLDDWQEVAFVPAWGRSEGPHGQ